MLICREVALLCTRMVLLPLPLREIAPFSAAMP